MENETPLAGEPEIADVQADSAPATEGADTPAADPGKPARDKVQERIDTLTREKYEAQWRADQAEQMLRETMAARQQPPQQKPGQIQRPTLAQFEGDEGKFYDALNDYTERLIEERISTRMTEREAQAEQQNVTRSFKQKESDFLAKTPDYHEKVYNPAVPISQAMAMLIAQSDDGPAVAYHLASHVELAARIAQLPPIAAAREIGRIEAALAKPATPSVSRAPPPVPQLPNDAGEPVDKASDQMTDDEWFRRREKEKRKRK